ncbi:Ni/Co efflux regulator RcnB [Azospirillum agricola]|uniref:RcnB family protein n=1 Tax=Azospirillum agricola TaxID=1720247 RepID=UPI001AE14F23|nr:RcnB family protein [Azospirillum agricola]MBP2227054.1 Ni/Co efflux regulator RcnB [Azospirillum agricola]
MKRSMVAALIAAVTFSSLAGSQAMAQGWNQGHEAPPPHARPDQRGPDRRGPDRPNDHRPADHRYEHRPERPSERHWRTGQRLPQEYRGKRHVIVKPASYHLHRPPRGHHWVRAGRDAVLVVSGTGVVIEFLPGFFR